VFRDNQKRPGVRRAARRSPVEFVCTVVDAGELVRDVAHLGEVGPSSLPRLLRIPQAVPGSGHHWDRRWVLGLGVVVVVDGQVPVRSQIPGQNGRA
jgi:hypothetical protein